MTSSIEEGRARKSNLATPDPEEVERQRKERAEKVRAEAKTEEATPPEPVVDEPVEKPAEETIEVSKTAWDEINKRLEAQERKSEFLDSVADKKAKALWYSRHKDEIPPIVKLSTWPTEEGHKVIVEWGMIVDEGEFRDPQTGRRVERQTMWIRTEDGKIIKDIPYAVWGERYGHVVCKQVGTETKDGKLFLKLIREDNGQEYTIDVTFVN